LHHFKTKIPKIHEFIFDNGYDIILYLAQDGHILPAKYVAQTVKELLRTDDSIGRFGGDEFDSAIYEVKKTKGCSFEFYCNIRNNDKG